MCRVPVTIFLCVCVCVCVRGCCPRSLMRLTPQLLTMVPSIELLSRMETYHRPWALDSLECTGTRAWLFNDFKPWLLSLSVMRENLRRFCKGGPRCRYSTSNCICNGFSSFLQKPWTRLLQYPCTARK
ncbi:hypothetical protein BGZ63DRAFT_393868 [Mariannaea sp. PMI_226]|nr:hypothetical protein BGZ63DRAFT_393868 [Mariannaea sp. PMI_226]